MKGWLVAVIFPFHTGKPQNDALPDSAAVRDMNAFRRSHFRFAQVDFQSPLKQLPRLTVSLKPDAQDRMYDRGKRGIMGSIRTVSYTHLDVYKRQGTDTFISSNIFLSYTIPISIEVFFMVNP